MNLSIKELNELIYSLGIAAHNGRFVNKDVNESLLEKLYSELNSKIAEEAIDEEVEGNYLYIPTEDKYESSVSKDYDNHLAKLKERGFVTQAILNFVDKKGAATFTEMNNYYKIITGGSNSFTHILQNLRTPYKNRKTQRYLAKEGRGGSNAKWVVRVANPSNWVIVDDYDEFSNQ